MMTLTMEMTTIARTMVAWMMLSKNNF
jgi:hypothetical protein